MTQKQFDKNFNTINLLKDGSEVEDDSDKIYKWCFLSECIHVLPSKVEVRD